MVRLYGRITQIAQAIDRLTATQKNKDEEWLDLTLEQLTALIDARIALAPISHVSAKEPAKYYTETLESSTGVAPVISTTTVVTTQQELQTVKESLKGKLRGE